MDANKEQLKEWLEASTKMWGASHVAVEDAIKKGSMTEESVHKYVDEFTAALNRYEEFDLSYPQSLSIAVSCITKNLSALMYDLLELDPKPKNEG